LDENVGHARGGMVDMVFRFRSTWASRDGLAARRSDAFSCAYGRPGPLEARVRAGAAGEAAAARTAPADATGMARDTPRAAAHAPGAAALVRPGQPRPR